jgi:hypothetical protein
MDSDPSWGHHPMPRVPHWDTNEAAPTAELLVTAQNTQDAFAAPFCPVALVYPWPGAPLLQLQCTVDFGVCMHVSPHVANHDANYE